MSAPVKQTRSRRWIWGLVVVVAATVIFAYAKLGVYTIQPIGALPEGGTAMVWREAGEPHFNSPDALCLERLGGVSLLCRGMAMGQAPMDRILFRLPYIHWAYLQSTGGREFDR